MPASFTVPWWTIFHGPEENFDPPATVDAPFYYLQVAHPVLTFDIVTYICRYIRPSRVEYLFDHLYWMISFIEKDERVAIQKLL